MVMLPEQGLYRPVRPREKKPYVPNRTRLRTSFPDKPKWTKHDVNNYWSWELYTIRPRTNGGYDAWRSGARHLGSFNKLSDAKTAVEMFHITD